MCGFLLIATFAAAQSAPTKIPLIKKNGLYYAAVSINGNAALLLIDTGASITLLNRKFSGLAVGLPASGVRGVGASAKGQRTEIHLRIGDRAFATDAMIGDFQIPDADRSLGSDVLAACGEVVFDYANDTLLLYRAEPMRLTEAQIRALLAKHGVYITEACDKCGQLLGHVRFTIYGEPGEWCSRLCRDGEVIVKPVSRRGGRPPKYRSDRERRMVERQQNAIRQQAFRQRL